MHNAILKNEYAHLVLDLLNEEVKKVDQNRCNSSSLGHRLHKKFMHVAMLFNRREVFVDK